MLSCVFEFFNLFGIFSHRVFQTWFVCHKKWHTSLFGIYYCVEMVRIKNNSHMLVITCSVAFFRFCNLFALSRIKWFKLGLFATKHGIENYLVYNNFLKWLESKTMFICLILCARVRFLGFFSVFGTFSHKVVHTWFVCHEKLHTSLFCIYYCVEKVRIENNTHRNG